jgi:hypothetical protein
MSKKKKPHIINYEYLFKPGKRNTSPYTKEEENQKNTLGISIY